MKKLNRTNLVSETYIVLREMLLAGERFHPGDKISVEELARELGVSRSPVWGAVARLEAEGLLEVAPRQGVFLASFNFERISEIFSARAALEAVAAQQVASLVKHQHWDIAQLSAAFSQQETAATKKNGLPFNRLSISFSRELIHFSGNLTLQRILSPLHAQIQVSCGRMHLQQKSSEGILRAQKQLILALKHGSGDDAEKAVHLWIGRDLDAIKEAIATNERPPHLSYRSESKPQNLERNDMSRASP